MFSTALYDAAGVLVKAAPAYPTWGNPSAQEVADLMARAADEGCTYHTGMFAVWADPDLEPAALAGNPPQPDAIRAFGPGCPPVPAYRWEHGADWATTLIPA